MEQFDRLAIDKESELVFGRAPHPITTRRGLVIGGGKVYPELNFTLPTVEICDAGFGAIRDIYAEIVKDACERALSLDSEGFVVEFETLIEMTLKPSYAVELCKVINDVLEGYHAKKKLKTALRITPNDLREKERPPRMRSGALLENMLETFHGCARNGAELLAIESTGGKEIHDDALVACDLEKVIFALAIPGCRDMRFLWGKLCAIARQEGVTAAGDTACGFGNTAMVLAEKKFIPRVFAALVRAATIARSLAAYEMGAVGPGKDCGYENPFLKAITGRPMAMEGKSAACAHSSPLGNIAAATCDLWSNESVQNIKLLGGMAPTVSLEQLEFDCRLMNRAAESGQAHVLKRLFCDSDASLDPQALILTPENVLRIAGRMVAERGDYRRTRTAVAEALRIISEAHEGRAVKIPPREVAWLAKMRERLSRLPDREDDFIAKMLPTLDRGKFLPAEYGLG